MLKQSSPGQGRLHTCQTGYQRKKKLGKEENMTKVEANPMALGTTLINLRTCFCSASAVYPVSHDDVFCVENRGALEEVDAWNGRLW